jgi:hypothetical protein
MTDWAWMFVIIKVYLLCREVINMASRKMTLKEPMRGSLRVYGSVIHAETCLRD